MLVVGSVRGQSRFATRRIRIAQIAMIVRLLVCFGLIAGQGWILAQAKAGDKPSPRPFGSNQPLAFVPNRGQYPSSELYAASGAGYQVGLEKRRVVVTLPANLPPPKKGERPATPAATGAASLSITVLGASSDAKISANQVLLQKNSFLPTGDPKSWITGVPSYGRVDYAGVYKGVNLDFYGQEGRLEYDFTLAPGADAQVIRMGLDGVGRVEIDKKGDLVLHVASGSTERQLHLLKPVAYQLSADGKQKNAVAAKYEIAQKKSTAEAVGFALGSYDHSRPLVIDPVLAYGEYLSGTGSLIGAMTVDTKGNTFIAGNSNGDATSFFIQKLDPNGNVVFNVSVGSAAYASYLYGIAIDSSDDVFVTGIAGPGLPTTTTAYQQTPNYNGYWNPFLSVLKADGSGLSYSTYFGGSSGGDYGQAVAVDSQGKAYITGRATSPDFPTSSGAYEAAPGGGQYFGFLAKIDPTLSGSASLVYSTALVSPSNSVYEYAVAVDSGGNAYVTGESAGFPVTSGAYSYAGSQTDYFGAYVTKVNPTGTALVYSADLGPGQGNSIAVDGGGNAYVTGTVTADDFPTTSGAYQTSYAGGFATKLTADGSSLLYSTFLSGPSGYNSNGGYGFVPTSIALPPACASNCAAYIAGYTNETDLPLSSPAQSFASTSYSAFLVELAGSGNSATYSTYLSGLNSTLYQWNTYNSIPAVAVDSVGDAYLAMNLEGSPSDAPTTLPLPSSAGYGYVAKVAPVNASLALALPSSVNFGQQPVNVSTAQYGLQPQPVELRNLGSKPLNLQTPFVFSSNEFSETDNCVSPIAAGGICTLNLSFTPSSSGPQTGTLSISSDAPNTPTTLTLTGSAVDGSYLLLSPTNLSFSDQVVGTASATQTVTVKNIGDQVATISSGSFYGNSADYTVVSNCPAQLSAGQSCQVGVSFAPAQVGLRNSQLYDYNYPYGNQAVSLSGTGVAGTGAAGTGTLTLSATSLNFGTQAQGSTSATQYINLYNTGSLPVTVNSATVTTTGQSGSGDFQITQSYCYNSGYFSYPPASVAPQSSCSIAVTFAPSTTASETGTITITDSTSGSPHTVSLSGVGIAAAQTLESSPANFVFPDQPLTTASATQRLDFYDVGTAPLIIDRVLISGGDFQIQSTNCAETTLQPNNLEGYYGSNCYVDVTFAPTATGSRTGTLTLIDSAGGSPQVFNLMGNGITATGTLVPQPAGLVFNAQPQGTTSTDQYFQLYNPGNTGVQINSLTTTGDFAVDYSYCGPLPYVLASGSNCQVRIDFTPMQTSGAETGTVIAGSSAGNFTVNLSGTAQAATQAIGLTPTTFNFGSVQRGTPTGPYTFYSVYVRNTGTEGVTFSSGPAITGTNAADFAIAGQDTCANIFSSTSSPLAPGTSCAFIIGFTPSTTSAESATLTLTDSAGTQTMTLNGTGTASQPAVTLSSATLPFDLQVVGTTSSQNYYVSLTNNGSNALTIQSAAITAGSSDFVIPTGANSCSGQSVAATGGQCYVYVNFAPSAAGYRTGALTFTDQNNLTYTVALAGYAPAPSNSATLDPQAIAFLPQAVNATSGNGTQSTQYLTLTNTGNRALTLGTLTGNDVVVGTTMAGDFSTASGVGYDYCSGQTVLPNSTCSVDVAFTPSTTGSKSGSITFPVTYADNTTATFTGTLSGQAVNETDSATLSPTNVSFLDQVAAHPTTSNSQYLTLTNNSTLALTVGALSGTDTIIGTSSSGDFVAANTTLFGVGIGGADYCSGQTLPPHATCSVTVFFAPGTTGAKSGSITVPVTYTSGKKASFTATLSGNALAAVNTISATPASTQFQSQIVGTTDNSNNQAITIQNTGNIPVTFAASTISGSSFTIASDGCGGITAQPGSSCTIYPEFTPQANANPGTLTGTLTINDSATGNPHKVSLSGTALAVSQQLAVSQSTVNFGSQAVSTTSNPQVVYVINQGTSSQLTVKSVLLGGTNATDFTESDSCGGSSGTTLNARSTCAITVTFAPGASSTGARTATVTVTPTTGTAQVITLNGIGTNPIPQAAVFPTTINFGSQPVNTTSTTYQYFTVANSGSATLSVKSVVSSDSPEFAISSDGCSGQSVAANSSCIVSLTFTPSASGSRSGTITVTDNTGGVANSTQTVSVSGTGTGTSLASLSPTTLTFPSQTVNTTSSAMPVKLTNGGTAALSITSVAASGNFGETNNCGTSLAAGSFCTINVTFDPQSTGTLTGSLTVTDNANGVTGSAQSVSLSGTGTGIPQATLSATSEVFSSTPVNTKVSNPGFTLSNGGTGTLTIASIAITGTNAGDFSEADNCNGSVAAGSNCSITVSFTPSATGSRTATLTFTDNANGTAGSTQTVSLSGTGLGVPQASPSPGTLSFGSEKLLSTTTAQTVTLTNGGSGPLSITNISVTGANPGDFPETTTCTGSLSSTSGGNTCTVSVSFAPQGPGSRSAALLFTDNANGTAGSTQTVSLSGTGVLNGQTITFASLPNVTYGVSPITLGATASSGLAVSYTVTGPATVSGSTLSITGAGSVTVTASQAGNADYAAATSVSQTFTVNKAALTVTASNVSLQFGQAIPTLGYTLGGFVNGDTS
ncbi:MAG: choice-of-anchor D domain-containing protein, partial [Silvibacterium sp.]